MDKVIAVSGDYAQYAEAFRKEYGKIPEMEAEIQGYKPYMHSIKADKIPCTRVKYILNDKEYEMVFVGSNGVVCYNDIPNSIKAFELSENEKAYMKRIAYKRHAAIAALTAYIFNLDEMDATESKHLNLLLKHMCLNALARDRKVKYLSQRYTADVDPELMLDKTKCLFISKKTICYAWQCMAVDKKISPAEQVFFNQLVARFNTSVAEVETLKRYSIKFATLDDEQFAKEYLDSPAVYRDPNYRRWNTLIIALLVAAVITMFVALKMKKDPTDAWVLFAVFLIGAGFVFYKHNPFTVYDQKDIDRVCGEVSAEDDLTEADYIQCTLPYRIWYKIVDLQIFLVAKAGILFDKLVVLIRDNVLSRTGKME